MYLGTKLRLVAVEDISSGYPMPFSSTKLLYLTSVEQIYWPDNHHSK